MLGDRAAIALVLEESGIDSRHLVPVLKSTKTLIERLQADRETASSTLGEITERVDLTREGIRILLKLSKRLSSISPLRQFAPSTRWPAV